jgi:cyclopropane-fatty-acyl-phospholipid synthase
MDEEFLATFLGPSLSFSAGLFSSTRDSLEQSEGAKFARLADQLRLDAADHLLEIGTGFGGFAIYAASERGCKVTASLLSPEHHAQVQRRVRAAGVEDLVTVTTAPFLELTGRYDKIAAIESLEQFDRQHQRLFFPKVSKLLTTEGVAAVQTTLAAGTAPAHRHRVLRRYGFALGDPITIDAVVSDAIGSAGLGLIDFSDLTPHAVATIRRWREGYPATSPEASAMERRFDRLFQFVLCYTEALYAERRSTLSQYTLVAPGWRPTGLSLH